MKKLSIKFDSNNEYTCKLFVITTSETKEDIGFAFVISPFNMVILALKDDINLTQEEQDNLKEVISDLYKTAHDIGFVVDIITKDVQI